MGVIGAADALGARVDWRAYALIVFWVVENALISRWVAAAPDYDARVRRYGVSVLGDVVLLAVMYLVLDAVQYAGAVFFAHMVLIASATLPRRWTIGIAIATVGIYSALVAIAVAYGSIFPSPIGLASPRGNPLFLVGAIASVVLSASMLMHLQSRLVRSIRDAERRYITVVQAAADMVMTFDEQGRFLEVNPATIEQSGYTWEDLKALPNRQFFRASDWPAVFEAFARTLAGESLRYEVQYVRKDGEARWLQTSTAPLVLDGRPAVLVIARDVTESRRQTDALRERDERLKSVLDALEVGFIAFDRDKRVTALFGEWAREQDAAGRPAVGAHLHHVIGEDHIIAQHGGADDRVLAGEDVVVEWTNATPEGDRRYRSHLKPIRDGAGVITGAAGIWVDETDRHAGEAERATLRARVEGAERVESLGKLVSGVAHELNNPLAAILNFTEDLLGEPRTPEERMALEVIQAQALRSRTIVRDLLTYVRQGSPRPLAAERPGPILETLARGLRPGLAAQVVQLVVDLEGGDVELMLDRAGVEQVVTNLVTNAAHAAGTGGTVRLSSRRRTATFDVIVEDNGAGIPAHVMDHMFEPFFTTKATGHGVGLGLSVSLGIVQAHGGTLTAENRPESVGGGARFVMRLPVPGAHPDAGGDQPFVERRLTPAGAPAQVVEAPSGPKAMPGRRPTMLVVEDEAPIRLGLNRYLTKRGWAVEESGDGADALARLMRTEASRIYDVVLCDLKMPGLSGSEVFDRVKAAAPAMARRFILTTGDTSAPDVAAFLEGVDVPVLEKPFELASLEAAAQRVRAGLRSEPA